MDLPITTVFLDAGYTLFAPEPSVNQVIIDVCADHGVVVSPERLEALAADVRAYTRQALRADAYIWEDEAKIREYWAGMYELLLREHIEEDRRRAVAEAIYEEFGLHSRWSLYPDVRPAIRQLRERGYQIGVISDWGVQLPLIVHAHDLSADVDALIVSANIGYAKPDPSLFAMALARLGARPEQAVHVGDLYWTDVLGARAAGITPVLLCRDVQPPQLDCLVVRDLLQLVDLLPPRAAAVEQPTQGVR